jgi:hypothetical protein
MITISREESKL